MLKAFRCKHTEKVFLREQVSKFSQDICVPARRINEIVHGKRAITANTALRLSRYFRLSERFWLNLQTRYDLETEKNRLKGHLEEEVKVLERKTA
ncbi:MAG: HigA family addiction module antitoxin [Proteobacteria bacterium]|nr:HigA family addiction module antitoxin [Pseudomonadota bacterium]